MTEETNGKLLALNQYITAPDSPHELGWLHHNHLRMSDIWNSVDLSWVCEYQRTRHSYLKQCLQSLRIYNKSFKAGGGEKFFELVDMILYNDYSPSTCLESRPARSKVVPGPDLLALFISLMAALDLPMVLAQQFESGATLPQPA